MYSNIKLADIRFIFSFCKRNARSPVREYRERYLDRRIPRRSVFVDDHLKEDDSFHRRIAHILAQFNMDPTMNVQEVQLIFRFFIIFNLVSYFIYDEYAICSSIIIFR